MRKLSQKGCASLTVRKSVLFKFLVRTTMKALVLMCSYASPDCGPKSKCSWLCHWKWPRSALWLWRCLKMDGGGWGQLRAWLLRPWCIAAGWKLEGAGSRAGARTFGVDVGKRQRKWSLMDKGSVEYGVRLLMRLSFYSTSPSPKSLIYIRNVTVM